MSDTTNLVVAKASGNFSLAMFKKVQGLAEDSPMRKLQGNGALRLTVDGDQFHIKKGSKVVQTLKANDDKGKLRPVKELDIVLHWVSPVIQKQAAVKYDPRDPKFEPIGCWSNDGNKPDADVWNQQSGSCDTCKFGKGADAKATVAGEEKMASCGLTRLAVVSLYSATDEPEELMMMNFNWSSNSTKKAGEDKDAMQYCMINYLRLLADMDTESYRVVTRLIVDDYSDPKNNCKLLFQPVGVLQDDAPNVIAHNKWAEEKDLEVLCKVTQREPNAEVGSEAGAPVETKEEVVEEKKAPVKKAPPKKRAPVKKKPVEVVEEELDELEDIGDEDDEPETEAVVEDEDDFNLDDLL